MKTISSRQPENHSDLELMLDGLRQRFSGWLASGSILFLTPQQLEDNIETFFYGACGEEVFVYSTVSLLLDARGALWQAKISVWLSKEILSPSQHFLGMFSVTS